MEVKNIPVQVITFCDADGSFRPLRFRYEAQEGLITVRIDRVLDVQSVDYVGIEAFIYMCQAVLEDRAVLFELKYTFHTHQWVLFRVQS